MNFESHLRQHRIEDAAIEDIGPARKAKLQARGLNTALDMTHTAIEAIPGFGPGLTKSLMDWRRIVEASFIFITSQAISPHEMQGLDAKYDSRRSQIQSQLSRGENELKKIAQDAALELGKALDQIKTCLTRLHQAEADFAAIPAGL